MWQITSKYKDICFMRNIQGVQTYMLPSFCSITRKLITWFYTPFREIYRRTCENKISIIDFLASKLMMAWTSQQKSYCVEKYISNGSFLETQMSNETTYLVNLILNTCAPDFLCIATWNIGSTPTIKSQFNPSIPTSQMK